MEVHFATIVSETFYFFIFFTTCHGCVCVAGASGAGGDIVRLIAGDRTARATVQFCCLSGTERPLFLLHRFKENVLTYYCQQVIS